jgi:hypothetical protein
MGRGTMGKLTVVFVMVYLVFGPGVLYAEPPKAVDVASQLEEIELKLGQHIDKLVSIVADMGAMGEKVTPAWVGRFLQSTIETAHVRCTHARDLLPYYRYIKPEFHQHWHEHTIGVLKGEQAYLAITIRRLQTSSSVIRTPAFTKHVVAARDVIRSSLRLFDKATQLLEGKEATRKR